jgi:hypothetical protein
LRARTARTRVLAFAGRCPRTASWASASSTCSTRASRPRTKCASGSTIVSRLVPRDHLWAVPDGGFRALRPEIAQAKLAAMVAAAKLVGTVRFFLQSFRASSVRKRDCPLFHCGAGVVEESLGRERAADGALHPGVGGQAALRARARTRRRSPARGTCLSSWNAMMCPIGSREGRGRSRSCASRRRGSRRL